MLEKNRTSLRKSNSPTISTGSPTARRRSLSFLPTAEAEGLSKGLLMNKKERVDAALRGDPVDRVPASMWGHDFEREWNPHTLTEAMVENFARYDWDYM